MRDERREPPSLGERRQAAVAELGLAALAGGRLPVLFARAAELARATLEADAAVLSEVIAPGAELRIHVATGLGRDLAGSDIARDDLLAGRALAEGAPLVVYDLAAEPGPAGRVLRDVGVVSSLVVLIHADGGFWGSLALHSRRREAFAAADAAFLQSVANVLGSAIDRALAEARHHLVVDAVEDYAILTLDTAGCVQSWNAGAQRLKGYAAEEILGQHLRVLYPAEDAASGKPERLLQLAEERGRVEDEGWRVRKDGTRFWGNVIITALRDERGRLRGFGKVTRDLTERKRAEEALRAANERLEASERLHLALLRMAAHDLRSPLAAAMLQVELVRMRGSASPDAKQLEAVDRNLRRMQRLLGQLLDIDRITEGSFPLEKAPLDLLRVVEEAVDPLRPLAAQAQVALEVRGEPLLVQADGDRIAQVVTNLVMNAVQASPPGVTVRVEVAREGAEVRVRVLDQGLGLTRAQMDALFLPFGRVHEDRKKGSGLGLWISRAIVERHGGRIGVVSDGPGKGAAFVFTLPAAARAE